MNYKITITGSEYPHNETETVTVTAEQLISALINEFDYDITVDGIDATVSRDLLDIYSADAYLDDLEASMHDAVLNALYGLVKHNEQMES